jgi:hypothetical protein
MNWLIPNIFNIDWCEMQCSVDKNAIYDEILHYFPKKMPKNAEEIITKLLISQTEKNIELFRYFPNEFLTEEIRENLVNKYIDAMKNDKDISLVWMFPENCLTDEISKKIEDICVNSVNEFINYFYNFNDIPEYLNTLKLYKAIVEYDVWRIKKIPDKFKQQIKDSITDKTKLKIIEFIDKKTKLL